MASNREISFVPKLSWKLTGQNTTASRTAVSASAGEILVVYNASSSVPIVVAWGDVTVTAVAPDGTPTADRHVVAPGSTQTFTVYGATHVSCKAESSTADVHFSRGYGA